LRWSSAGIRGAGIRLRRRPGSDIDFGTADTSAGAAAGAEALAGAAPTDGANPFDGCDGTSFAACDRDRACVSDGARTATSRLDTGGAASGGVSAGAATASALAEDAAEGTAAARTLVTMARAAIGVFSGSVGRLISDRTTPAPAVAPIAVATKTTRAVRAKLGAGAR
jgi:hypothetical protein